MIYRMDGMIYRVDGMIYRMEEMIYRMGGWKISFFRQMENFIRQVISFF